MIFTLMRRKFQVDEMMKQIISIGLFFIKKILGLKLFLLVCSSVCIYVKRTYICMYVCLLMDIYIYVHTYTNYFNTFVFNEDNPRFKVIPIGMYMYCIYICKTYVYMHSCLFMDTYIYIYIYIYICKCIYELF
jgi:lysylphosphatidylglycerol synthetase-like protein (DUF2156 family)